MAIGDLIYTYASVYHIYEMKECLYVACTNTSSSTVFTVPNSILDLTPWAKSIVDNGVKLIFAGVYDQSWVEVKYTSTGVEFTKTSHSNLHAYAVIPKGIFTQYQKDPTPSGGGGNEIYISDNGQWVSAEDYIAEHGQWPSESE